VISVNARDDEEDAGSTCSSKAQSTEPEYDRSLVLLHHLEAEAEREWEGDDDDDEGEAGEGPPKDPIADIVRVLTTTREGIDRILLKSFF